MKNLRKASYIISPLTLAPLFFSSWAHFKEANTIKSGNLESFETYITQSSDYILLQRVLTDQTILSFGWEDTKKLFAAADNNFPGDLFLSEKLKNLLYRAPIFSTELEEITVKLKDKHPYYKEVTYARAIIYSHQTNLDEFSELIGDLFFVSFVTKENTKYYRYSRNSIKTQILNDDDKLKIDLHEDGVYLYLPEKLIRYLIARVNARDIDQVFSIMNDYAKNNLLITGDKNSLTPDSISKIKTFLKELFRLLPEYPKIYAFQ